MLTNKIISDDALVNAYLPSQMANYFYQKIANEAKETVKIKIIELLKYLSLCQHTSGPIPFSKEIDHIWHLWILQTKQYQTLMRQLPGKQFIHHCAKEYTHESIRKTFASDEEQIRIVSFLASYVANFGPFKASRLHYWPTATNLMHALECDVNGLNQFLHALSKDGSVC